MYSTSIPLGGLGFSSFTIGLIQGVAGFVGGIIQIFAFPWMHRKLGSKRLYTLSYSLFVVVFALFPLLSLVTKRAGKAVVATWVLVVLQFVVYLHTFMTWGKSSALGCTIYIMLTRIRRRMHLHVHQRWRTEQRGAWVDQRSCTDDGFDRPSYCSSGVVFLVFCIPRERSCRRNPSVLGVMRYHCSWARCHSPPSIVCRQSTRHVLNYSLEVLLADASGCRRSVIVSRW